MASQKIKNYYNRRFGALHKISNKYRSNEFWLKMKIFREDAKGRKIPE